MASILLVDDEKLILYSLSTTLRRDGASVFAAETGKEALGALGRAAFDICFLDVNLPDANGLALRKEIEKLSPATRIVIMTAVELDYRQINDLYREGYHFLPKPFDLEQVRALVAELTLKAPAPSGSI